ncbi:MAG: potassium-transporting ATPase subunit KdpB [SAR324 cluster bacterium]|nr:potassium-transporting ATPase subunit KdpB [SAR324 cluster bacterium]
MIIPSFNKKIIVPAIGQSFLKLDLRRTIKNPTIFIVELSFILTLPYLIIDMMGGRFSGFEIQLVVWLFITLMFANFSEAIAEAWGKSQANDLRSRRTKKKVRRLEMVGEKLVESLIYVSKLKVGDVILCKKGDIIPVDGEVIEGIAIIDESAITGESAPVIRESGSERSVVTGGTRVISDFVKIKTTTELGSNFSDKMINLVEGVKRGKTPNEMALTILLSGLSITLLLTVTNTKIILDNYIAVAGSQIEKPLSVIVYLAILICIIPTTIGALLSAIGISGMDRLFQTNVIALNGKAVEATGDIDLILLDKTGTLTLGNRWANKFIPQKDVNIKYFSKIAQLASISDKTPEGRSIVLLAKDKYRVKADNNDIKNISLMPFSASTQMSGVDIKSSSSEKKLIRKGSLPAIIKHIESLGGVVSEYVIATANRISKQGGTPLVLTENKKVLGVIHLKDVIKGGIKNRFSELRKMGIKTVMITGDNQLTAASIAAEAGVDDFLAGISPEGKLEIIKQEQAKGYMVAMAGDGINDAPALAQANVGVAMNTGTKEARDAGNLIDLDSNPIKLIDIIKIGKQIVMTRGSLTTFSVTNDVAKFFAIFPTLFGSIYAKSSSGEGPLSALNIMRLESFESAILSTIIFNALIILALIPLVLRGVKYKANKPFQLLIKNMIIYGGSGIIAPFIGIKLIDMIINFIGLI